MHGHMNVKLITMHGHMNVNFITMHGHIYIKLVLMGALRTSNFSNFLNIIPT
jgi:hypothetical protein